MCVCVCERVCVCVCERVCVSVCPELYDPSLPVTQLYHRCLISVWTCWQTTLTVGLCVGLEYCVEMRCKKLWKMAMCTAK